MRPPSIAMVLLLPALLPWLSCTRLESARDLVAVDGGGAAAGDPGRSPEPLAGQGGTDANDAGQPGSGGDAGGGAPPSCPSPGDRSIEVLAAEGELTIDGDTTWSCEHDYEIRHPVIVAPGATLTIAAGVTLKFAAETMLLVGRGARIDAQGSAEEPITLTSAKPEGMRAPGDYRGLILIGAGPSQSSTVSVHDSLSDSRAHYGGGQAGNREDSCGSLRYVRIQFAGGSVDDTSLPAGALTLAGCGTNTIVDYVQVHRATDGVGLLGGTVALRHLLVTNNLHGEAIEWSAGYTGHMQYVVAQSLGASAAMQGSNSADDPETVPVSRPTIYNATLVGSSPLIPGQNLHYGFLLRHGSRAVFKNSIVQGFTDAAFDLRLDESTLESEVGPGKPIDISHALMHHNAKFYSDAAAVLGSMESMRAQDPGLVDAVNPTPRMPNAPPLFVPVDPTVNTQPAVVPIGLDSTAGFRGAVPQDGVDWTTGWPSYPID